MSAGGVFVTVGSTSFDTLVREVTEERFTQLVRELGYTGITVQLGRGTLIPDRESEVNWYRYKPSLQEDMTNADLIISHGGAGCIMESLLLRKPLIVVINEELMNNHQTELARQLSQDGHLLHTTTSKLYDTVKSIQGKSFIPFSPSQPSLFGNFVDTVLHYK